LVAYYKDKFDEIDSKIKLENKPDLKIHLEKIMEKKGSNLKNICSNLIHKSQTSANKKRRIYFL